MDSTLRLIGAVLFTIIKFMALFIFILFLTNLGIPFWGIAIILVVIWLVERQREQIEELKKRTNKKSK